MNKKDFENLIKDIRVERITAKMFGRRTGKTKDTIYKIFRQIRKLNDTDEVPEGTKNIILLHLYSLRDGALPNLKQTIENWIKKLSEEKNGYC